MSKGSGLLGLAVSLLMAAFGCEDNNSVARDGGAGATGRGGGRATGAAGAGGMAGSSPSAGAPGTTGVAGIGGAVGAAGASAGGAAGAGGAGMAGAGGGSACGDPLTHCSGMMNGTWCLDTVSHPSNDSYMGFWANRPDSAWLVGGDFSTGIVPNATGLYAHFDGCAWTVTPRPDLPQLLGVWEAAPNDAWIVGSSGNAFHWNGSTLTAVPVPGATILDAVHGTSSTDVWAVGAGGLFHWNGSAWTQSSTASGNDVWAVAPNDVWVASGATDVLHFDGTTWTATPLTDFGLFAIWADGTQAYAGGEGEALFHFAGGSWTTLQGRGGSSQGIIDIGGFGADIFAPGNSEIFRLSGNTFTPITDGPDAGQFVRYRRVWVSPAQIWFANGDGNVAYRSR